jgi:chromatin remodeling complex protein RSC6
MSTNTNGSSTMSKSTSAAPKRVQKKSEEAPVVVAAPAAPAAAAASSKKKVAAAAATPVAAAPVVATPVASEVTEAAKVEVKSVDEQLKELIDLHQKLREQSTNAVKTLQKLQKQVAKDLKEAGRRRRRASKDSADGSVKEKRPTIFTTPVTLRDPLCAFLGLPNGSQKTPADVTRAFSAYVESHKLKDAEKGHTIHPDLPMRQVLGVKEGEQVTYRNIQSYLYKLYVLPEKKSKSSA